MWQASSEGRALKEGCTGARTGEAEHLGNSGKSLMCWGDGRAKWEMRLKN